MLNFPDIKKRYA